jgi:hypothetical protein
VCDWRAASATSSSVGGTASGSGANSPIVRRTRSAEARKPLEERRRRRRVAARKVLLANRGKGRRDRMEGAV